MNYFSLSQGFIGLLLDVYRGRLPVREARLELEEGFILLSVKAPLVPGELRARLVPEGVCWGDVKELSFRFEEEGSLSLVKTAVRFIRKGVRIDGDLLWVDITQFWDKLPAEMRWNTRISRIEIKKGEARVYLERF
ncbi:MAG: hypothetical protein ABIM88_00040 [candidate division WOR-3 bacterium]